ncbi:MAG: indole-3-glycerol phosphate synthase TrpC [Gemmatimonadota bacterium]
MSILDAIVREKRAEVGRLGPWAAALRRQAEEAAPTRSFAAAVRAPEGSVSVIAEVKRKSPSAGWIRRDANAAGLASMYAHGGASAISVLTDGPNFGGDRSDLESVRAAVVVPVLRKDFIVDPVQVYETRAMGADAMLLIVRILDDAQLGDLLGLGEELGLAALVEVHDGRELDRALGAGARVVGINNRDLKRFETDLAVTERLAPRVPPTVTLVGESGIDTAEDVDRLGAVGVDAVLVGEAVAGASDPMAAVEALAGRSRSRGARGSGPG